MPWSNCFNVDRLDRRPHRCCGADRHAVHHHQTRCDEGHGAHLQGSGDAEAR
jgi:hypothetical protein